MRGGAVSAATAASTGPRKPAARACRLALPRQKLLYCGQVSRARRFEKFLLLSHCGSQGFRRRRGEKKETGEPDCRMKFLCDPPPPPFFNPTDSKLFPTIAARLERKQKLPPPMDPFIPIHGAAGGKVWSAARFQHRANFLWPVPRAPSVTSLKLPFSSVPTSLKPSAQPRHPHPSCSIKKWMGINNMAPQHKKKKTGSDYTHHALE